MKNTSITSLLLTSAVCRDDIATMFSITDEDVACINEEIIELLEDASVSPEEFKVRCDEIDQFYNIQ